MSQDRIRTTKLLHGIMVVVLSYGNRQPRRSSPSLAGVVLPFFAVIGQAACHMVAAPHRWLVSLGKVLFLFFNLCFSFGVFFRLDRDRFIFDKLVAINEIFSDTKRTRQIIFLINFFLHSNRKQYMTIKWGTYWATWIYSI